MAKKEKATDEKKEGNKVREVVVSSADMGGFILRSEKEEADFFFIPGKGRIAFADTLINAEAQGFHKISLPEMDRLKDKLEKNLIGVQNGNAGEKDIAQKKFREALIAFKKAIRGEWQ